MRKIVLLAALLPYAALIPPVAADERQDCSGKVDDLKIKACTALITSGRETKPNLAMAYHNRGIAHARKKDYDLAIADYSKAIELDPRYAAAYNDRALAYTNKGDFQHAVADVGKAVELGQKAEPSPPAMTAGKKPASAAGPASSPVAGQAQPPSSAQTSSTVSEIDYSQPKWAPRFWRSQSK